MYRVLSLKVIFSMTMLVLIATLLLLYSPIPQSDQQPSSDNDALTAQAQSGKVVPSHAPDSSIEQPDASEGNQPATQKQAHPDQRDWITTVYYISGPLVFIVALGTAILVWRQIEAMRSVERAWIVVKKDAYTLPSSAVLYSTNREPDPQGRAPYLYFQCTFTNVGKTPAKITACDMSFTCAKTLPTKMDYKAMGNSLPYDIPKNGRFLAPEESFTVSALYKYKGAGAFMPSIEDMKAIQQGELAPCAYASVRYLDAFEKKRETRICFYVAVGE
jgi:hypothetical protein